jgi:hypothetical protein
MDVHGQTSRTITTKCLQLQLKIVPALACGRALVRFSKIRPLSVSNIRPSSSFASKTLFTGHFNPCSSRMDEES